MASKGFVLISMVGGFDIGYTKAAPFDTAYVPFGGRKVYLIRQDKAKHQLIVLSFVGLFSLNPPP